MSEFIFDLLLNLDRVLHNLFKNDIFEFFFYIQNSKLIIKSETILSLYRNHY